MKTFLVLFLMILMLLKPFIAAIDAGTSAIMPYFAKPINTEHEEAAYTYNRGILNDLLRGKPGFKGIADPAPLLETIKKGLVTEARIDESGARLITEKIEMGIFENYMVARGSDNPHDVIVPEKSGWDVEFVNSPEEADVVLLLISAIPW